MPKHKKQHFVPACYLKAWCDPDAPASYTPYLWLFDKDGSNPRNKAPENIFHETDMYTIHHEDGSRNLVLEHGLSQLEAEFVKIRKDKIARGLPLDPREHILLCAFTAAAHSRTPSSREHIRKQWKHPLRVMNEMNEWLKTATSEEKRKATAISPSSLAEEPGLSYDQVKRLHDHPLQTALFSEIRVTTPLLRKLDMAILETQDSIGFITSDNPCIWFDPESPKRHPMYRSPALAYESIEITLPISPTQCLFLNRRGIRGYTEVKSSLVDELNRRLRFMSVQHFVVRRNLKRDFWFTPAEEPTDS